MLGGGIAANITIIVVVAAVALVLIGLFNGLRNLVSLCELRATSSPSVSRCG